MVARPWWWLTLPLVLLLGGCAGYDAAYCTDGRMLRLESGRWVCYGFGETFGSIRAEPVRVPF